MAIKSPIKIVKSLPVNPSVKKKVMMRRRLAKKIFTEKQRPGVRVPLKGVDF